MASVKRVLFLAICGAAISCAFAQNQCQFIPVGFLPGSYDSRGITEWFPHFQALVLTNGHYVTYNFFPRGDVVYIYRDGKYIPNYDPVTGQDNGYSTLNTEQLMNAFCPGYFYGPGNGSPSVRLSTLSAGASASAGEYAGPFVNADFDGDGIPDSAALTSSGIIVTLGSNGRVIPYSIPAVETESIVSADFNSDGHPDLAVVTDPDSSGQGSVAVLLGNGDGTFGPPTKFAAGPGPFYLIAADLNHDGYPDLAVTNIATSGTVSVLIGKGDGTFSPAGSYTVGPYPGTIVAADFTGDGNIDLVTLDVLSSGPNKLWLLPGNGDGTFQTAVSTPVVTGNGYLTYADLNNDGRLDLVIADEFACAMAFMMGNGDGTFQFAGEYAAGAQPVSFGVISLGDGNTAVLSADNLSNAIVPFIVAPDGTLPAIALQNVGTAPAAIAAADLNGDSQPDLAMVDRGTDSLFVELNTGSMQFAAPQSYPLHSPPTALVLTDLNGDGVADAIVAEGAGIDILLGQGDGTFGPAQAYPGGGKLLSLAVADFNGDGKPDVASVNSDNNSIALLFGNGDGSLQAAQPVALPDGFVAAVAVSGDFNNDGLADLLVTLRNQNPTQPGAIAVLLGKGDGTFQTPNLIDLPGSLGYGALTTGDLNSDGMLDAVTVVGSGNTAQVISLLGNGDGTFKVVAGAATQTSAPQILVIDQDGDGHPDLFLADCCSLSEATYLGGNGDGTFQAELTFPSGPSPSGIAAADFDGDGIPDLALIGQIQESKRGTVLIVPGRRTPAGPAQSVRRLKPVR